MQGRLVCPLPKLQLDVGRQQCQHHIGLLTHGSVQPCPPPLFHLEGQCNVMNVFVTDLNAPLWTSAGTTFENKLSSSVPQSIYLNSVKDFLCLSNINTTQPVY